MIVRRAASAYGVSDPELCLARLRQFSQPSEVQEPIELLQAGLHFHACGLFNSKAIQHNMDWVWPIGSSGSLIRRTIPSFSPRAFSFSHINLTHRNWTAVGLPELPVYPIVDPRGLVTPMHDGWGQKEDKRRSREAGFDDHFVKPAEPSQLQHFLTVAHDRSASS